MRRRLLVVDDATTTRLAISVFFQKRGLEVLEAQDCRSAIEVLTGIVVIAAWATWAT